MATVINDNFNRRRSLRFSSFPHPPPLSHTHTHTTLTGLIVFGLALALIFWLLFLISLGLGLGLVNTIVLRCRKPFDNFLQTVVCDSYLLSNECLECSFSKCSRFPQQPSKRHRSNRVQAFAHIGKIKTTSASKCSPKPAICSIEFQSNLTNFTSDQRL